MAPTISVIITTYNQAAYIGEALESVLAQTLQPLEVIVVDDGSTDDTAEQVARFTGRIRYIRQKNQGVAGSRNTGVRAARGELLAFLDGDDVWETEKLAAQAAAAQEYSNSGVIAVDGIRFGDSGVMAGSIFGMRVKPWLETSPDTVRSGSVYSQLIHGNFILTTSQVMIPARILAEIGLSDGAFRISS